MFSLLYAMADDRLTSASPSPYREITLSDDEPPVAVKSFEAADEDITFRTLAGIPLDVWQREQRLRTSEALTMAAAVALRRVRGRLSCTPGRTRSRESHRTRRGHARRPSRRTTSSAGSDDSGPGSEPPSLRLAPRPAASYSYGTIARERWGLE